LADNLGYLDRLQEAFRWSPPGRSRNLLLRIESVSVLQAFSVKWQAHGITLARRPKRVDPDGIATRGPTVSSVLDRWRGPSR
jgi:hypothetical protein